MLSMDFCKFRGAPGISSTLSLKNNSRSVIVSELQKMGFETKINLSEGIKETMDWFMTNQKDVANRYNVFKDEVTSDGVTLQKK